MLIRFSLQNFKSFDHVAELSMLPSAKLNSKMKHISQSDTTDVLKYSVIYGANASGKSNWVKAIEFFRDTVMHGLSLRSSNMFCKAKKKNSAQETKFEIQFSAQGRFYAYGFSVILKSCKITDEWLYELYSDGRVRRIYERDTQGELVLDGEFLTEFDIREQERMGIYREDFAWAQGRLFLTFMNQEKRYSAKSPMIVFKKIFEWITQNLVIVTPDKNFSDLSYYSDVQSLEQVNEMIKKFDTGISHVDMRKSSLEEMEDILPPEIFLDMKNKVQKGMQRKGVSFRLTVRSKDVFFSVRCNGDDKVHVSTLRFRHKKSDHDFLFSEESDGTRRLFDLLDMILNDNDDIVYIVDELERSLHPRLTEYFLRLFMKHNSYRHKQLIFTTHEASIMDRSLFRRDEIWFVERSSDSTSRLYSLDQFRDRYDNCLSKAYLEGRYGAVPILSSFDYMEDKMWE